MNPRVPLLAAVIVLAAGCDRHRPTPSSSLADCIELPGEDIGGLDWSSNGRFLLIQSDEPAKPGQAGRDVLRLMDDQRQLTEVHATEGILGATTVDADGTAWWTEQVPAPVPVMSKKLGQAATISFTVERPIALFSTSAGIVYATSNEDGTITTFWRADSPQPTELFSTRLGSIGIWVSADGAWTVLGDRDVERNEDHYTLRHDGQESQLAPARRWSTVAGMTPDRSAVLYVVVSPETFEFDGLYKLPIDGTPPVLLGLSDVGPFEVSDTGVVAVGGSEAPAASQLCFESAEDLGI